MLLGGAELSFDLATAYRESSQVLLFEDGPFRERLEGGSLCQSHACTTSARSTHIRFSAFKALPALWWMAHRVVEAGQGFDLVHANSEGIYCAALAVDRISSYLASTRHFNRTPL